MLIVLAARRAIDTTTRLQRGNFRRSAPASPRPVTIPIRAQVIWTAAIRGHVSQAVQSKALPSWAPAIEYVAIPEGSPSAAPVMRPGPIAERKRRSGPGFLVAV